MKSKNIQLDIRARSERNERELGQAPSMGKVPRLRDKSLSNTSDLAGASLSEASQNPALRKLVLLWSAIFGVVALVAIGAAFSFWMRPSMNRSGEEAENKARADEARARVASKFPSPSENDAVNLVKRALSNRDPARVATLVRTGSASPADVIAFFKDSEARDGTIKQYDWLSSMDADGVLLEGVNVTYQGHEKPSERLALLTPNSMGVWKLDFDAFARTVKPSWKEILASVTDQATVRVLVGRDAYYNGLYIDETQWVCYGIASPDIEEPLRAYCRVGTGEANAMEQLFSDGQGISRATLEIRHVKEADPRQFEISRVLAKDWVIPD